MFEASIRYSSQLIRWNVVSGPLCQLQETPHAILEIQLDYSVRGIGNYPHFNILHERGCITKGTEDWETTPFVSSKYANYSLSLPRVINVKFPHQPRQI